MEKIILRNQTGERNLVIRLYAGVFAVLLFITWLVFVNRNKAFDQSVFTLISPYITPGRTAWMKVISFFGNHKFLVPANLVLIAIFLLRKKKHIAWQVTVVAFSSLALKLGLKELFQRPRPDNPLVDGISNFSYPSGHALMSVAFFGLLIWIADLYIRNALWRRISFAVCVLIILLISFSRIYLRVHYTTDVIAGLCLGTCWLYFCIWFTEKIHSRRAVSGLKQKP